MQQRGIKNENDDWCNGIAALPLCWKQFNPDDYWPLVMLQLSKMRCPRKVCAPRKVYTGRQTEFLRACINKLDLFPSCVRGLSYSWVTSIQQSPLICITNNAGKTWHRAPSKLLLLLLLLWHPKEQLVLRKVVKKINCACSELILGETVKLHEVKLREEEVVEQESRWVTGITPNSYWGIKQITPIITRNRTVIHQVQWTSPILTPRAQRNPWQDCWWMCAFLAHTFFQMHANP